MGITSKNERVIKKTFMTAPVSAFLKDSRPRRRERVMRRNEEYILLGESCISGMTL